MKPISTLRRMTKQGDLGFPRATIAFYGPDDRKATKVVLGLFLRDDDEGTLFTWSTEAKDARYDTSIQQAILDRIREHEVKSVAMMEQIFGCPHQEGIDYPEGEACPECPFWNGRDRFGSGLEEDAE